MIWPDADVGPLQRSEVRLVGVLLLQELGDGVEPARRVVSQHACLEEKGVSVRSMDVLDVAGALVDGANLAVAEKLLGETLTDEAHAAHPLDGLAADLAGDLGCVELGHGGVAD